MNLVMAAMVALGCWGFAISYIFLTTDPNRYALGGLADLASANVVNLLRHWFT